VFSLLHPSELGSSFTMLGIVLGLSLALPGLFDRNSTWQRSVLFGIAALLALRYLWWRVTQTVAPPGLTWNALASWSFLAIEAAALASSISAFLMLSRVRNRSREATESTGWWGKEPVPRVAVVIATYNEAEEVLERSIIGAKALDHPAVDILVLDDGRREWLREFRDRVGVRHVTRPDNADAKAGNITTRSGFCATRAPLLTSSPSSMQTSFRITTS
jgi:cellulose synthase (UDP-forming)